MVETLLTRRRALTILALGVGAAAFGASRASADFEWRGEAMGAQVRLLFAGEGNVAPQIAVEAILEEIERLERIFSLSRETSELSILNRRGRLDAPSPDLVAVLNLCARAHRATGGLFDPTVQPLWNLYVDWYSSDLDRTPPDGPAFAEARERVGFDRVAFDSDGISLRAGTSMTLNGVAQGYVTDRGVDLLKRFGFSRVLVDLGEMRALGRPAKGLWKIDLPEGGGTIGLQGGSLATSAGSGTVFAHNGDHHLFDPRTGRPARCWRWLTVHAGSAIVADALSTGLYIASRAEIAPMIRAFPRVSVWAADDEGRMFRSAAHGVFGAPLEVG
jgi:thiamine biosynthesis lipoprotein